MVMASACLQVTCAASFHITIGTVAYFKILKTVSALSLSLSNPANARTAMISQY
jgi:hypothetical protein